MKLSSRVRSPVSYPLVPALSITKSIPEDCGCLSRRGGAGRVFGGDLREQGMAAHTDSGQGAEGQGYLAVGAGADSRNAGAAAVRFA